MICVGSLRLAPGSALCLLPVLCLHRSAASKSSLSAFFRSHAAVLHLFLAMVHYCGVVHCKNNTNKCHGKRFFVVPRVIKHQGENDEDLSTRRRNAWIAALRRKKQDLTEKKILYTHICADHFVSGV
jgi:hypothetical protein